MKQKCAPEAHRSPLRTIAGSTCPLKRKVAAVDEDALDAEVGRIRSAAVLVNQPTSARNGYACKRACSQLHWFMTIAVFLES